MEIMQNGGSLGYQGRFEILAKVIPASFNVPMISQVILGRHWGNLDDGQKDEFIALYEKLITATYASQFDDYDGETFTFKNDEELGRGRKLIKTELHTGDGEVVNLDYLMSEHNGRWLIISVIANGANDISIKRGEYADVIKNRGYPALLNEIRKKITEMSA
jgi:phospholipid transport system substrate-binding protein